MNVAGRLCQVSTGKDERNAESTYRYPLLAGRISPTWTSQMAHYTGMRVIREANPRQANCLQLSSPRKGGTQVCRWTFELTSLLPCHLPACPLFRSEVARRAYLCPDHCYLPLLAAAWCVVVVVMMVVGGTVRVCMYIRVYVRSNICVWERKRDFPSIYSCYSDVSQAHCPLPGLSVLDRDVRPPFLEW